MTRTRSAREPASLRTLRAWRRIGLVLGSLALAAYVLAAGIAVLSPPPGAEAAPPGIAGAGTLVALLAVVFLRRVWSEPRFPTDRWTPWGERMAGAFVILWSLAVVAGLLQFAGVPEGPLGAVQLTLLAVGVACFVGAMVVAFRRPAGSA